jgi:putative DNA primase/helicase
MGDMDNIAELAAQQAREHNHEPIITEDTAAILFTMRYKGDLLFDHDNGQWFRWVGTHWKIERTKLAFDWARLLVRELADGAQKKTLTAVCRTAFASGVERFAQADRAHAITSDGWDADPFLLGTPGGCVDLRDGTIRPMLPSDRITKITGVAPAKVTYCPRWIQFLMESTGDDEATIRFLQQFAGYCLTGSTEEHALMFAHGDGGNGKSVFLNTVAYILGDYATAAPMDTFTASQHDRHPTDLAMLRGARLVMATETEEGRQWAESKIKQLTGGDPITARFMRRDFFTYRPQFKLLFIGNHKPTLRNVDDAAKRRFKMVPFNRTPENPDKGLEAKLRNEGPGILAWAIDGCLDWQENGLCPSPTIIEATKEYFDSQDLFGHWLADCCDVEIGNSWKNASANALYTSWSAYSKNSGEPGGSQKSFGDRMRKKGFTKGVEGHSNTRVWKGLRLKADAPNAEDGGDTKPDWARS